MIWRFEAVDVVQPEHEKPVSFPQTGHTKSALKGQDNQNRFTCLGTTALTSAATSEGEVKLQLRPAS